MRKKVVLASVLKPCNDVRMYEKLGKSLSDTYEIHYFGEEYVFSRFLETSFCMLFSSKRWQRLKASWTFFRYLLRIRPDFVIVCTVELLPAALLYRILFAKKLIYDVQENYVYNFIYQQIYPFPIKYLLAFAVRLLEWVSRPLVNHYLLAEKTYAEEFSFSQGKHTILENKAIIPSWGFRPILPQKVPIRRSPARFVYSGTISEVYGALEALEFILTLKKDYPTVELLFIGRFAENKVAERIIKAATNFPRHVKLIGGNKWVYHNDILNHLSEADIAILPYRPNKSTANCIPTKLYECLALHVPMLISANPLWQQLCEPYQAAVFTEFGKEHPTAVMERIRKHKFYLHTPPKEKVQWIEEKRLLKNLLERI